jgi:SAM-dependent methyltransferase
MKENRADMTESEDYRDSHLTRGAVYDQTIFSTPLDAYADRWEAHHLERVVQRLLPVGILRYLDFACGTGRITQRVEPFAAESYGVDISESMLTVARSKCDKTRFVCVDLTREDPDLGLFDLVTSFRFFGNAQDELRGAALSAIARRMRPGGHLVINNHRNPRSLMALARRIAIGTEEMDLSHRKLESLLRGHGFKIVFRRAIGFWIIRAKLTSSRWLESPLAAPLERAFQNGSFARYSPDSLLVARKVG